MSVFSQAIYTQTASGSSNTITFNNIPQGFTDLKLVASVRSTATGSLTGGFADGSYIALNGGTANSSLTFLYGGGTSAASSRFVAPTILYLGPVNGANSTSNTFSSADIHIPNYTIGNFKSPVLDLVAENNATTSFQNSIAMLWRNTQPIVSLSVVSGEGSWAANSTFTLYGISNIYDTAIPVAPTVGAATDQAGFVSLEFVPAANDGADSYVVTSSPAGSTTYGAVSPIKTPAVLGTAYTYRVASVNALGTSQSAASASITTDNSYASIATIAVSTSTNSVTFTNIPQHYTHLQLRCFGRSASGTYSQLDMNINGDASNAYTYHTMYGDGANAGAGFSTPRSNIPQIGDLIGTANTPGVSVVDVLDYTATTKYKTVRWLYGSDINGAGGLVGIGGSAYMNFSPVSAITLTGRSQNIGQYSHFALYGIA
jgi:hypothetical protein